MPNGVVALLGSGETAPGMTRIHRAVFERVPATRPVLLDTPYSFQGNVPEMTEKLTGYFSTSLGVHLEPLHFESYDRASDLRRTEYRQSVADADYVFAGPGSPSWALAQWRPLGLGDDLAGVVSRGGALVFASAAALTLGAFTAPIYEIYKAGVPAPYWLEGLDVLGRLGIRCAVVPHFDNAEGRNYDTRYCYLGERHLTALEALLPEGVAVLGVDEHSALLIDFEARTLSVRGRGQAYWRLGGEVTVLGHSEPTPLDALPASGAATPPAPPAHEPPVADIEALAEAALAGGPGALDAVAALTRRARGASDGAVDPAPLIDAVLAARTAARDAGAYDVADHLRDAVVAAGVVVTDTPSGTTWHRPS